ncbi:unnamed protein product [Bursaphelenchus xylophilus]|nr:unnamed protein product [Bursaphelenchus xylophilus]CAG9081565.1 unnamed protein product [Bursaphelenchus xylophilus]
MNLSHVLKFLVGLAFISTLGFVTWFLLRYSDDTGISKSLPLIRNPDIIPAPLPNMDHNDKEDVTQKLSEVLKITEPELDPLPPTVDPIKENVAKVEEKAEEPADQVEKSVDEVEKDELPDPDRPPSVHIFYYPWYGDVKNDGKYYHWDHRVFYNREPREGEKVNHLAPGDIASVYYPQLGAYSSKDTYIIDKHFKWMKYAKIDVVVVSWYPVGALKYPWEDLMPIFLDSCAKYHMKLAFHMEPYTNRSALSVRDDLQYLVKTYGDHPAFYRTKPKVGIKLLPAVYVYDSYLVKDNEWKEITTPGKENTIRGTWFDAMLIGLALQPRDVASLKAAGFDGIYTYFAADGFTGASSKRNWKDIAKLCREHEMLFDLSIGPGYDDSRVRPWNGANTRTRNDGKYYVEHFEAAYQAKPDILSITSFNEWHEGTQIEPAVPFTDKLTNFSYPPYENGTDTYLRLTKEMIEKYFSQHQRFIREGP